MSPKEMTSYVIFHAKNWDDPAWRERLATCMMVLATGIRVTELCNVRVPEDADYDGAIIVRSWSAKKTIKQSGTKEKRGRERLLRIPPWWLPWYQEWYREVAWEGADLSTAANTRAPSTFLIPRPKVEGGRVFEPERRARDRIIKAHWRKASRAEIEYQGQPQDKNHLQMNWTKTMKAIGIKRKLSIHKGRHTFATHMRAYGLLDLVDIQNQLGHSTIDMTANQYSHAVGETLYSDKEAFWIKTLEERWEQRKRRMEKGTISDRHVEDDQDEEDLSVIRTRFQRKAKDMPRATVPVSMSAEDIAWLDEQLHDTGIKSRAEYLRQVLREMRRKAV